MLVKLISNCRPYRWFRNNEIHKPVPAARIKQGAHGVKMLFCEIMDERTLGYLQFS